jgi:hypothetical protein
VHLRPLLLAGSAFLAVVHVIGVLASAPVLPWAAAGALTLLLIHAGAGGRNYPLLAALAVLTVHALATMPEKAGSGSQFFWAEVQPDVIDEAARRDNREAALMLLVVTLLLFASLADPAPTRGVLLGGGIAMLLTAAYPVVRIGDIVTGVAAVAADSRTHQDPWAVGAALSLLAAVPVAVGVAALFVAVVAVRRPWVVAGAVLLVLGSLLRTDQAIRSLLLPYEVAMDNPFAAWDRLTSSTTLPGLAAGLRAGLELAGIILVAAGLSHRAARGRVGEG